MYACGYHYSFFKFLIIPPINNDSSAVAIRFITKLSTADGVNFPLVIRLE